MAHPWRRSIDFDLLYAQGLRLILQHQIKKSYDLGANGFTRHPESANVTWRDCGFCPRPQHAVRKLLLGGAGYDEQIGEFLVGYDRHHQVVFILRKNGDQALGMFDAGFAEGFLFGGVTHDVQHVAEEIGVGLADFLDRLLVEVNDYIVRPGAMQFFRRVPAGISQAADDIVSPEFADSFLHGASPKGICDFDFYQESRHHGKHVDRDRYAEEDHSHVEDAEGGVMSGVHNLSIANAGQCYNGHIECLQKSDGWSAEQAIASNAYRDETQEQNSRENQASAKH